MELLGTLACLVAVVAVACVRTVPDGQQLVIRRPRGHVRASGPGLALTVPLLETLTRVPTGPQHHFAVASAATCDGANVHLHAQVTTCVRDVTTVHTGSDRDVIDAVEEELHRYVSGNRLRALPAAGDLLDLTPSMPRGVELVRVLVDRCDVEVTSELRRLVRHPRE